MTIKSFLTLAALFFSVNSYGDAIGKLTFEVSSFGNASLAYSVETESDGLSKLKPKN